MHYSTLLRVSRSYTKRWEVSVRLGPQWTRHLQDSPYHLVDDHPLVEDGVEGKNGLVLDQR